MQRLCPKRLLFRRCGAAIALAKGLRRRPAKTNLHTIRARTAIMDRFAGAIQIPPWRKWTVAVVAFNPMQSKPYAAS
jgi:hypothetical protein